MNEAIEQMAAYTVRAELKGDPSFSQYEKLHALMAQLGFGRTVKGDRIVSLPHAAYDGQSSSYVVTVRDTVKANVKAKIQTNIVFYVAKTERWAMGW